MYKVFAAALFAILALVTTAVQSKPTVSGMTDDGRLTIDGKPRFLIALMSGPPAECKTPEGGDGWKELAEGGVLAVQAGPQGRGWTPKREAEIPNYINQAYKRGIYCYLHLREYAETSTPAHLKRLAGFIDKYKNLPGLLYYRHVDEPEWGKKDPEHIRAAYEVMRRRDPNHLVWICHAPRGTLESLRQYNDGCDMLATDIYPVSDPPGKHYLEPVKGLSIVGDYTTKTVQLAERKKMVQMVIQVFWSGANPGSKPANRLMYPTFRQERYMMYQSIINGANGICFFGIAPFGLFGADLETGFNWTYWRAVVKPLLAEIKPGSELAPLLQDRDSTYPLEFSGAPQIEVRCKEAAGVYLYILAAAREGNDQTVTFSNLQDGEVEVLHENRTLEVVNGSFTDDFAPHDVHIYRALKKNNNADLLRTGRLNWSTPADPATTSAAATTR